MKIYNSFVDISDNFDVLLVDAYGVFWDGGHFYKGSLEAMESSVKEGKKVCILSNTTSLSDSAIRSYEKKGMILGKHYTDFVTSGDVIRRVVLNEALDISGKNIYMWGTPKPALFEGSSYNIVDNISKADAFYISIPQLASEQKTKFPQFDNEFYLSRISLENGADLWDSMIIEPFIDSLHDLYLQGLPALCANPDFRAFETPKGGGLVNPVLRQGAIAEAYRKMGGLVIEFGKPHANIYQYTFQKLGIEASQRVAMIGDTFRTDIVGAIKNGISPVWCVKTGMAKYETEQGKTLEQICNGDASGVYMIKSLGGNID